MKRRELFSSFEGVGTCAPGATVCGADLIPNVLFSTHDGKSVRFYDDLVKGKQVVINMMYATCEEFCPLITARLVEIHEALGELMADADDLAVKAAILLKNEVNGRQGADIFVEKSIPSGGGFGGGSSDAATVLCALDLLWGLDLGEEQLAALGLRLGADVPVFVRGRNAWGEGVGERLLPMELEPAWYVLVDPGLQVPTAALFQSPDLTRDSVPAKISDFAAGSVLDNVFEPVLRRREPAIEAVFAELARIGTPRLTGTGSGCFVEFAHPDAAREALARLPRRLRAWVAAGVPDSPLRAALASARRV